MEHMQFQPSLCLRVAFFSFDASGIVILASDQVERTRIILTPQKKIKQFERPSKYLF